MKDQSRNELAIFEDEIKTKQDELARLDEAGQEDRRMAAYRRRLEDEGATLAEWEEKAYRNRHNRPH